MARITKPASERRQEIIDTARELFIQNGFIATQISDISKRMNVAQGLVYHYFKSKTDVLYAVIDELAEENLRATAEFIGGTGGTARDKLAVMLAHQPDLDRFGKLIPSIVHELAIVEYCANKMHASILPLLVTLIEQGNADGSWNCQYPQETALFILRGASGLVQYSQDGEIAENKKNALREIIVRILG